MTLVEAVFLDIDGTLVDTNDLHVEVWACALEEVRDPVPRALAHEQIGKGSDELIPPSSFGARRIPRGPASCTRSSAARSRTARTPCREQGS